MRQLKIIRNFGNHDPLVMGAQWYGALDAYYAQLPEPEPAPLILLPVAPEPEPASDAQHNDHVMTYWTWRLDRLDGTMRCVK